jgi:hypothetical protein
MAASIIISELCPYCSKPRSPRDIVRMVSFRICADCLQRHRSALLALTTGEYSGGCSECGRSMEEIQADQGGVGVQMAIHYEGGIYRPMCLQCDSAYVPKRSDLYKGTQFWKEKGL